MIRIRKLNSAILFNRFHTTPNLISKRIVSNHFSSSSLNINENTNNNNNENENKIEQYSIPKIKDNFGTIDPKKRPIGSVYRTIKEHLPSNISKDSKKILLKEPNAHDFRTQMEWTELPTNDLPTIAFPPDLKTVPKLEHGLDHVLKTPGVHFLQDTVTRKYNFPPYLKQIIQPEDLHLERLPPFIPSSQDKRLHDVSAEQQCQFSSSTSSISPILAQFCYLVTNFRQLHLHSLSSDFARETHRPVMMSTKPISFFLRPQPYGFAIDAHQSVNKVPDNWILLQLGKTLEGMLTLTPTAFKQWLLDEKEVVPEAAQHDVFHYLKIGNTMLRSQLDCYDPTLPGPFKTFDLKTRAALPIRRDIINYRLHSGYRLDRLSGFTNSFEREYYDMARSAFMKYNLQVRIGCMGGIFVAYHNTKEMFGFEYLSKEDLDQCLFGSSECGDKVYTYANRLSQAVFERIAADNPEHNVPLRCLMSCNRNKQYADVYTEEDPGDGGWAEQVFDSDQLLQTRRTRPEAPPQLNTADKRAQVTGRIRHYRIFVKTLVNDEPPIGGLSYQPGDDLRVEFNFEKVGDYTAETVPLHYLDLVDSMQLRPLNKLK